MRADKVTGLFMALSASSSCKHGNLHVDNGVKDYTSSREFEDLYNSSQTLPPRFVIQVAWI